jgi:hypothetical protein
MEEEEEEQIDQQKIDDLEELRPSVHGYCVHIKNDLLGCGDGLRIVCCRPFACLGQREPRMPY